MVNLCILLFLINLLEFWFLHTTLFLSCYFVPEVYVIHLTQFWKIEPQLLQSTLVVLWQIARETNDANITFHIFLSSLILVTVFIFMLPQIDSLTPTLSRMYIVWKVPHCLFHHQMNVDLGDWWMINSQCAQSSSILVDMVILLMSFLNCKNNLHSLHSKFVYVTSIGKIPYCSNLFLELRLPLELFLPSLSADVQNIICSLYHKKCHSIHHWKSSPR